jgi:beta-glucosidase
MQKTILNVTAFVSMLCLIPVLAHALPRKSTEINCGVFTKDALPKAVYQTDPEAIERFHLITKEVRSSYHAILFLGDSLTQKWDPSIWDRYFAARGALNEGVNGDRTEHLLWRLEHGNLDGPTPKAIVLLIGTNDIGRNRLAAVTAEDIRAILMILRSRFPTARILLLGVLPRSELPGSRRRRQVSDVNHLIRKCGDGVHIFYADVGDALLDRDGRLTRKISPDGVHLSRRGYALLAARLERELDTILVKREKARRPSGKSLQSLK